ncbi:MAG TPA: protein kinase [Candidatus Eisenbacteria bacterium]|nr:protein kinase [Candidatus Eisenbacteria bacterium]
MPDESSRKPSAGPLRAFANLFRKSDAPLHGPEAPEREDDASRIGHYSLTGEVGRGGMGVVYAARDSRLERVVAIKTMSSPVGDEEARQRFWREARAAASVNHPNIAQIYDIGEHRGGLYIAMELLEGESLADRLRDGPLPVSEAIPIVLGILAGLSAVHARGIIHRDLKPSNIFLTRHGVKLLDFGLARPIPAGLETSQVAAGLTQPGMLVGTPRYIAPEQVAGGTVDGRADLFAMGAILFEMLAGRPAFTGNNIVEVLHATIHEQPPALSGSPAVAAVDRVIRRALAKRPEDRPANADAMAEELRAARGVIGDDRPALAQALTRLVVLPFRVLRADPETDFLAFSLADAIATSLSGFSSLVVRSTSAGARFATDAPDLRTIAAEADVDRVVMGTLLRAGDQLRVTAQLVEAPGGTLVVSHTATASMGDLFGLQDDLTKRVVNALALPLGGPVVTPDRPANAHAYGLYLEANALGKSYDRIHGALDLYRRSVELDPRFAPAWAELGRTYRIIGKFVGGPGSEDSERRAEEALRRALELSPRLPVAHKYYAHLEGDTGHSLSALKRLLDEAALHQNDPEIFAGLVHACRYCGLIDQAIAADEEARRLDPNIHTSLEQALLLRGDVDALLHRARSPIASGGDVARVVALGAAGRRDEALALLRSVKVTSPVIAFESWVGFLKAWLERSAEDMVAAREKIAHLKIIDDPEACFQEGLLFCDVGNAERGFTYLRKAVEKEYFQVEALTSSPLLDGVRGDPRYKELLGRSTEGRLRAVEAFREKGGERILGPKAMAAAA